MIYHLLRVLFTFIAFVNQRSMSTLLTYSNKTHQSEHGQDEVNMDGFCALRDWLLEWLIEWYLMSHVTNVHVISGKHEKDKKWWKGSTIQSFRHLLDITSYNVCEQWATLIYGWLSNSIPQTDSTQSLMVQYVGYGVMLRAAPTKSDASLCYTL